MDLTEEELLASMFATKKKKKKSRPLEESVDAPLASEQPGTELIEDPDDSYEAMLSRIYDKLNASRSSDTQSRLKLKPPRIERVGTKRTSWSNFRDTAALLSRQEVHLQSFYNAELGAQSSIDSEGRLILKGKFSTPYVESILKKYISTYVQCIHCRCTNTTIFRDADSRLTMMKCSLCLAQLTLPSITQGFHATTKADRREAKREA